MKNKVPQFLALLVMLIILTPLCSNCQIAKTFAGTNDSTKTFVLSSSSTPAQVKLFGYVKDSLGKAVASSYIYLSDNNYAYVGDIYPNSSGYYEFTAPYRESFTFRVYGHGNHPYLMSYIPSSKTVFPGLSAEVDTDFILLPGANIIVNTFDNNGSLLRTKDFREVTGGNAYDTNLDDLPSYGVFDSISDDYSQGKYELTRPACIVFPQTPFAIHILWEIPGFGKVILTADNSSKGYLVEKQGGQLDLNFNYEATKSKIAAFQRDYDQAKNQNYAISDPVKAGLDQSKAHLKTAEVFLSNNDVKRMVEELNLALNQSLWAHEQLLFDKARADIENGRKNWVSLNILDSTDKPAANYSVTFTQVSASFLFGADPIGKSSSFDQNYVDLLKNAGVNYSFMKAPWGSVEPEPGKFDWSYVDSYQNITAHATNGFKSMGSLAVWFSRGGGSDFYSPTYQDNMTLTELESNAYEHMKTLSARYNNSIGVWEINEQNSGWSNVLNLTWTQKIEVLKACIQGVKAGNPSALILFNANALPYEFGHTVMLENLDEKAGAISFPEFLSLLIDKQVPVDIIG
jgi:hypothetical protein